MDPWSGLQQLRNLPGSRLAGDGCFAQRGDRGRSIDRALDPARRRHGDVFEEALLPVDRLLDRACLAFLHLDLGNGARLPTKAQGDRVDAFGNPLQEERAGSIGDSARSSRVERHFYTGDPSARLVENTSFQPAPGQGQVAPRQPDDQDQRYSHIDRKSLLSLLPR